MDPLSIAVTAAGLVRLCTQVSGSVYTFISKTRATETAIRTLAIEVDSLAQVLGSIEEGFKDPLLAAAAVESQTGYEGQHWRNVRRSLDDCKGTLDQLNDILEPVRREGGFLRRARKQISLSLKSENISLLKQQVSSYRHTMQLSLHLITVYVYHFVSFVL
jgi:hypothetical protein